MQKFKVITLGLSGIGNKIWQSQDVVTVKDLPSEENVLQHVLTGGLHPLNEDGTEMERVIITQEMIDQHPDAYRYFAEQSKITIKPGMYVYEPNGSEAPAAAEETTSTEETEPETTEELPEEKTGEATEEPRTEVPNDGPLTELPAEQPTTEAPKPNAKKSATKK